MEMNKMKMFLIDTTRNSALIHRMDVTEGKYECPLRLDFDSITNFVTDLMKIMLIDRPEKVIVDTYGTGIAVLDTLKQRIGMFEFIQMDDKGNMKYYTYEELVEKQNG
ncbi:hypothetical protein PQE73_gp222 [Bacillus phage vB_BanS_MrDarsey]|uniref:Uncharacterized protein n=1 Tax=Bacillus phage vB_BanS_MrDarsey TaxID=2894787 RepID=A0AAE9CBX6_9CAUD|nr:hypothetical protein PQE73_gp222 [Bacillus phage vB_BanS_MrDarsey]UGO48077.1 hypothetical protein MRDARSEY_265 [Bacillus phage vB_BanS_MrDarsey]